MPKINFAQNHSIDHNIITNLLKTKISKALQEHAGKISNFSESWLDENTMQFAFKALGFSISGVLKSLPNQVAAEITLPMAAMLAKGMIESQLKGEIDKILKEATAT